MGNQPKNKKNQVRREMLERYGREVHEVNVDWNERQAKKHKGSWHLNQDPEIEDEDLED